MNWRRFFRREEDDSDQQQELDSYLDIATEQNIARGLSRDEARTVAQDLEQSPFGVCHQCV